MAEDEISARLQEFAEAAFRIWREAQFAGQSEEKVKAAARAYWHIERAREEWRNADIRSDG